ncbi:hypothetical protein [Rhizobium leguminosarum]|uniref:hypothetical protein n=1 Tax=Rhizobium leguminosarum TaxID=384 RepID=UPI001C93D548|nr:hypothetical protein [Rhizobium leguminosarum]MBY5608729.1 hypothetical protein [Rhizobium leguminosarum]MBY5657302.1 hypothetical protein [Rhizobium leguminosarum]
MFYTFTLHPFAGGKLAFCFWTGLALSLGAPFWFDILQKFINFRGAGTKPETTKEKKEKEVESDGQAAG